MAMRVTRKWLHDSVDARIVALTVPALNAIYFADVSLTGTMKWSPSARLGAIRFVALLAATCVWTAAASQTTAPPDLSATLRDHVKRERFEVVTSIRGLPLGVRDGLQALFGSQTLDIAESGAELRAGDVAVDPKPLRRLVAAGCSIDHCLVYYERGGSAHTWLVALFHWTPAATRFEWGGNARGGLASVGEVRNAVVSGRVKGPVKSW
jgi:hypothetical protein